MKYSYLNILSNICKLFVFVVCFWVFFSQTHAFLGEDLWLDIYKNIDEWLYDLEVKQYEYELSGQWEWSVAETVWQILSEEWVDCDVDTIQQMEEVISGPEPIWVIQLACFDWEEQISREKIAAIKYRLSDIKTTFSGRAEGKSKEIYEIARIWIYSDGSEENSPFDLMVDLQEIDRVIFSEEIPYEWEAYPIGDEALNDFLHEDKSYLADRREQDWQDEQDDDEDDTQEQNEQNEQWSWTETGTGSIQNTTHGGFHNYACFPEDESGLREWALDDWENNNSYTYVSKPRTPRESIPVIEEWYEVITDGEYWNGTSWGWPFRWVGPNSNYAGVSDPWACDSFFCIVIDISMGSQNLFGGGQTTSIESILAKVWEHMEKFANTSLVQSKMTTNNYELGLIIPDLSEMLRGFGIQVQTKPPPILNNVEQDWKKKEQVEWDIYTSDNLLSQYYKNIWLDYERQNDLDIHEDRIYEKKVLIDCSELSITCPEQKLNELKKFKSELKKSNEQVSLSVEKKALSQDSTDFYEQFTELERFVGSMDDFATSMSGMIKKMKKIPTRKS